MKSLQEIPETIEIWDCRHKNKAVIRRLSGDLVVEFYENNTLVFSNWYKLKGASKHNYAMIKDSYRKIIQHLQEIKKLLERQES